MPRGRYSSLLNRHDRCTLDVTFEHQRRRSERLATPFDCEGSNAVPHKEAVPVEVTEEDVILQSGLHRG